MSQQHTRATTPPTHAAQNPAAAGMSTKTLFAGLVMAGAAHHLKWSLLCRLTFAGYVGLMHAWTDGMDDTPRTEDDAHMSPLSQADDHR